MSTGITRMRGPDAGFLYLETPTMHMHTLKIVLLDPSSAMTYDDLVQAMLDRLPQLPALRRRVVPVPFALNHPILVTQREIDPGRHFFRHDIGGDGSMRDLERLIGHIASTPLDREVPLWEEHVCEGLADGGVAIVAKMHHAIADGAASSAMLAHVTDVSSADLRDAGYADPGGSADPPPRGRLVIDALRDAIVQMGAIPGLLVRTVKALTGVRRLRRDGNDLPVSVRDVPRVSFNGPLTPRRSFATVSMPMADFKAVRHIHRGEITLNDVVLAVVSGALRRWLAARDEHPRSSLTAGVAVGLDPRDSGPRLFGNNVATMFTTLATAVNDPRERLLTISRVTRQAKAIQRQIGSSLVEWWQFIPPGPTAAAVRAYSRWRGARLFRPPSSVIVSNVPGPRERVALEDAALSDVFSVGPLVEGVGLNVTVWSYVDRMNFSLLACPDLLPDVEVLASYFPAALAELFGDEEPVPDTPAVNQQGNE